MGLEEDSLVLERARDGLLLLDVSLTSVNDWDVSETERNDSTSENVDDIGSLVPAEAKTKRRSASGFPRRDEGSSNFDVHEIDLGQNSDGPLSVRIDSTSELESVRVGQIRVGSGDGEDDRVGLGDELEEHVTNLLLDVSRLVSDWDLGERTAGRNSTVSTSSEQRTGFPDASS